MKNKELLLNSKEKIESKVIEILDNEINDNQDNVFIKEALEELKRLSIGGKMVRGFLVKLGQLLFNKDDESFIDIAAALEIFQTAILIHDDIIDEGQLRRNKVTINAEYKGHHGISKGICVGDLGFFLSYKIISDLNISKTVKNEIMKIYATTLYNTVKGEIIDTELPFDTIDNHIKMDEKIIYDIYVNKTAWYTIIGPMLIGAVSAGASVESQKKLMEIGTNLGIAFQIMDDFLGLYSSDKTMGKSLNDIKEGKQTIIYKHAIRSASKEELTIIKKYYGNKNINESGNMEIVNLFEKLGSKEYALRKAEEYTIRAIKGIKKEKYVNEDTFIDFANYLLNRNK